MRQILQRVLLYQYLEICSVLEHVQLVPKTMVNNAVNRRACGITA